MKFTITSSFDFEKLLNEWDKRINPTLSTLSAQDTVKQWKANIDSGGTPTGGKFDKLSPATLGERKEAGISGTLPLKATGNLYNSIKADKNKISYAGYGKEHLEEQEVTWKGKKRTIPARKWQSPITLSKESFKKATELIKKSLKASGGSKVLFKSR